MADPDRPNPLSGRPVAAGLAALTAVAVVIGVLAGVTVLLGVKILGIGGGDATASGDGPSAGETLYLPEPAPTTAPSGPRITLDVDPEEEPSGADDEAEEEVEEEEKDEGELVLRTGQSAVAPMQRIDLSGSYGKDGAILQVQRKENGSWNDFPVTVSVRGGAFSTYVMTGKSGKTKFRVVDTDSGEESNAVTVQIG